MSSESSARTEYKSIREREAENKEYYSRDDGLAAPPHTLCLSVNNNCFLNCKMCDIGTYNATRRNRLHENAFSSRYVKNRKYREFDLELLKTIIDEVAPYKPTIKTNFVEPLLYRDLPELAKYVRHKGMKYYTITNGWMLRKHIPWLIEYCDLIRISLDGTEDIHDRIRGKKGCFQRAITGIKELVNLKRKIRSERPIVGVCFTVSNYNYHNLSAFMEMLKNENLLEDIYVNFNHLLYTMQWEIDATRKASPLFHDLKCCSIDNIVLEELKADELKMQIHALYEKFPQDVYHYYFSPWLRPEDIDEFYDPDIHMFPGTECYLPWYAAQLDIEGNVGIYGHCFLPDLGNALDNGFFSAWNSEQARLMRRELKKVGSFPACNKCIGTLYPLRGRK